MDMILCVLSVATLVVTVQSAVAMDTGSVQESEMVLDQKLFVQLLRRVENLEKRDQDQQTEIDSLRGEINTEKVKTARLEGRISRLQASLGKPCKGADDKVTVEGAVVKQQGTGLPNNTNVGKAGEMRYIESAVKQASRVRRQVGTPVVAFHAHLGDHINHAGEHQIISFEDVQTNVGNAYNPHFGSFVAPVSGVYVFHTTIKLITVTDTYVIIIRNGVTEANLWISGSSNESAMLVLHLNKGDDVAVRNEHADKAIEGGGNSMFSGFLLHQDVANVAIVG